MYTYIQTRMSRAIVNHLVSALLFIQAAINIAFLVYGNNLDYFTRWGLLASTIVSFIPIVYIMHARAHNNRRSSSSPHPSTSSAPSSRGPSRAASQSSSQSTTMSWRKQNSNMASSRRTSATFYNTTHLRSSSPLIYTQIYIHPSYMSSPQSTQYKHSSLSSRRHTYTPFYGTLRHAT